LAGNPNSGKTCVFNALTGQHQHIGNYPGVTVEKKTGWIHHDDKIIEIVDLPGTYSLSAYSLEEVVSRNFVLQEKPDVIIDILDSTNLERHLYLLLQFQELGIPVVGALNMSDEAAAAGIEIQLPQLQEILGIPLVRTIGSRGTGVHELLHTAIEVAEGEINPTVRHLNYGLALETAHNQIINILKNDPLFSQKYSLHWVAIKLLEKDQDALEKVISEHQNALFVIETVNHNIQNIEREFKEDSEVVVSEQRYAYIHGALVETVQKPPHAPETDRTEKIDRIVLNRFLGIPIFLAIMFLIYQFTFLLGNPVSGWISVFFSWSANVFRTTLPPGPLLNFLTDGIIGGVGGVLVFLPLVLFLFLGLSFLEDTGYMARAAFVMDKFFHIFGLHGRSFIPFMVSTGCAVPGIMSARVLANPKDRIVTILVSPIMMCGAKAPVIAMLAAAFFPKHAGLVFWSIWLFGWVMAFSLALLLRKTLFGGEETPFVMELPPFRRPTARVVIHHMFQKSWEYVKKAGTVILAAAIVVWFLLNFPANPRKISNPKASSMEQSFAPKTTNQNRLDQKTEVRPANRPPIEQSFGGRIGRSLEPILRPAGFDWKIGIAIFAGVAAKEVIISTLAILYGLEAHETEPGVTRNMLRDHLRNDPNYSPLMAMALMIFVMLYVPCIATLAIVKKELGSWKWPAFQALYTFAVALFLAIAVFQIGTLIGLGG
jgi:ferrous iron transport protein B